MRKTGTNIAEETLEEGSEESVIERVVRRPTAGTDTVTLVGVDLEKEKSSLKKVKSCESGER